MKLQRSLFHSTKNAIVILQEMFSKNILRSLIEISLGEWEGKEKLSVNQSDRKAFLKGKYMPPNAKETHEDVIKRVKSFFIEIINSYDESTTVLLVTSNGVIRTVRQLLKMEEIKINPSEFIVIDSKVIEDKIINDKKYVY